MFKQFTDAMDMRFEKFYLYMGIRVLFSKPNWLKQLMLNYSGMGNALNKQYKIIETWIKDYETIILIIIPLLTACTLIFLTHVYIYSMKY